MKKMNFDHVDAIAHARLFLVPHLDRIKEPRYRAEIEKDMELLLEVRSYILYGINNPTLPFVAT